MHLVVNYPYCTIKLLHLLHFWHRPPASGPGLRYWSPMAVAGLSRSPSLSICLSVSSNDHIGPCICPLYEHVHMAESLWLRYKRLRSSHYARIWSIFFNLNVPSWHQYLQISQLHGNKMGHAHILACTGLAHSPIPVGAAITVVLRYQNSDATNNGLYRSILRNLHGHVAPRTILNGEWLEFVSFSFIIRYS